MRSLVGLCLPLFCVVYLETSNGLMPAVGELMMLDRPGVEHSMLNIGFNLCLFVLRPRGSLVQQGSQIMKAPWILSCTPPVYISCGRH